MKIEERKKITARYLVSQSEKEKPVMVSVRMPDGLATQVEGMTVSEMLEVMGGMLQELRIITKDIVILSMYIALMQKALVAIDEYLENE